MSAVLTGTRRPAQRKASTSILKKRSKILFLSGIRGRCRFGCREQAGKRFLALFFKKENASRGHLKNGQTRHPAMAGP
jgi:hypothetical protein